MPSTTSWTEAPANVGSSSANDPDLNDTSLGAVNSRSNVDDNIDNKIALGGLHNHG